MNLLHTNVFFCELIQYFSVIFFNTCRFYSIFLCDLILIKYISLIEFNISLWSYYPMILFNTSQWSYSIFLHNLIQYFSLIVFNIFQWSYSMFHCDHIQCFSMMIFFKVSLILLKVFYNIYWRYFYFYIQEFSTMFISSPVLFRNFSSSHGRLSWPKMVVITEVGTPTSAVSNKLLICKSFIVFPRENHKK